MEGMRREEKKKKHSAGPGRHRRTFRYLKVSVFLVVFSVIYGAFSHGIRSFWMSGLFLWPLLPGALPCFLQERRILPAFEEDPEEGGDSGDRFLHPGNLQADLWRFGVSALTAASFLKGVLEIAGTDSVYPGFLLFAGAAMCAAGGILYLLLLFRAVRQKAAS